jgi:antitoxin ParD1/3/4
MNVNLGPVFDEFVSELLETGLYQSQSEILREGLRLLKERQDFKNLQLSRLRTEVAQGTKQADRGEFVDGRAAFASIRRRGAK